MMSCCPNDARIQDDGAYQDACFLKTILLSALGWSWTTFALPDKLYRNDRMRIPITGPTFGIFSLDTTMSNVGISHAQRLLKQQRVCSNSHLQRIECSKPQQRPVASWRLFVESSLVYAACVGGPAVLSALYYGDWRQWQLCHALPVSWQWESLCPPYQRVLSEWKTDALQVVGYATLLALLRYAWTRYYVQEMTSSPYYWPTLVRCKSSHLLSHMPDDDVIPIIIEQVRRQEDDQQDVEGSDFFTIGLGIDDSTTEQEDDDDADAPNVQSILCKSESSLPHRFRQATSIYRLFTTICLILYAYNSFGNTDFWPWTVGGTGRLQNVWKLQHAWVESSNDDVVHDDLYVYFLTQAVLHTSAVLFHVATVSVTWWQGHFVPVSASSVLQHTLLLVTIIVTYFVSSIRRLTAVGMFALDVSGAAVHLWHVYKKKPWVHSCVVLCFVWMRGVVWATLAWSTFSESSYAWFQQVNDTTWPDAAHQMQTGLGTWYALLLVWNGRYLARLMRRK